MLSRRAALYGAATTLGAAATPPPAAAAVVNTVVVGRDNWLFAVYDLVKWSDRLRMKRAIGFINEAVALLKQAGIETVVALTPVKSRIYPEFLPDEFRFIPISAQRYAEALALLRAPGTLVPDLAATLLAERQRQPGTLCFFKSDTHWTAPGAERAAIEIAAQMKARLNLPASPVSGTALGPMTVMRQGINDLASHLPDAMAAKYGTETYAMHPPAATALLEDDEADVLIVGNSFMQPRYNFSAMLSNQLGRPVVLHDAAHQPSPYRAVLDACWCGISSRPTCWPHQTRRSHGARTS